MPEKSAIQRAQEDRRKGKSPSVQAGEFVREEIHRVREGKHGVRSAKQAIAIGLSMARRAGVKLPPPAKGTVSEKTRHSAELAYRAGQHAHKPSPTRSRAILKALKREGSEGVSHEALAEHSHSVARHKTAAERSAAARKAVRTKGPEERSAAAKKAARTRAAHAS
jgi:hypothetical protein